jgi:hypothetical protein
MDDREERWSSGEPEQHVVLVDPPGHRDRVHVIQRVSRAGLPSEFGAKIRLGRLPRRKPLESSELVRKLRRHFD